MGKSHINMSFHGICTHLLGRHKFKNRPHFDLENPAGPVQHRVVLANSALISTHIDPARGVIPHIPKLRIPCHEAPEELAKIMTLLGEWYEYRLEDVAVSFVGENHANGRASHQKSLSHLPGLWHKTGEPVGLRRRVLNGWTKHASAYIDFTGGVKFFGKNPKGSRDSNDPLRARLHFMPGLRQIVFRPRNGDDCVAYDLGKVREIRISNLPDSIGCTDSDYLLHYFATNIDLCEDAPVWKPQPPKGVEKREKKTAKRNGDPPISDVFCSSSTYP